MYTQYVYVHVHVCILQMMQVSGRLKLSRNRGGGGGGGGEPHVIGLVSECRRIESSSSILELKVSQTLFTSTTTMDLKIINIDTKYYWILIGLGFYKILSLSPLSLSPSLSFPLSPLPPLSLPSPLSLPLSLSLSPSLSLE